MSKIGSSKARSLLGVHSSHFGGAVVYECHEWDSGSSIGRQEDYDGLRLLPSIMNRHDLLKTSTTGDSGFWAPELGSFPSPSTHSNSDGSTDSCQVPPIDDRRWLTFLETRRDQSYNTAPIALLASNARDRQRYDLTKVPAKSALLSLPIKELIIAARFDHRRKSYTERADTVITPRVKSLLVSRPRYKVCNGGGVWKKSGEDEAAAVGCSAGYQEAGGITVEAAVSRAGMDASENLLCTEVPMVSREVGSDAFQQESHRDFDSTRWQGQQDVTSRSEASASSACTVTCFLTPCADTLLQAQTPDTNMERPSQDRGPQAPWHGGSLAASTHPDPDVLRRSFDSNEVDMGANPELPLSGSASEDEEQEGSEDAGHKGGMLNGWCLAHGDATLHGGSRAHSVPAPVFPWSMLEMRARVLNDKYEHGRSSHEQDDTGSATDEDEQSLETGSAADEQPLATPRERGTGDAVVSSPSCPRSLGLKGNPPSPLSSYEIVTDTGVARVHLVWSR